MNDKIKKVPITYILCAIVIIASVCYILWSSSQLSNDTPGDERINNNIIRTGEYQQDYIKRIETVERGLGDTVIEVKSIRDQTDRTSNRIESSKERLDESSRLIARGQEILRGIQERSRTETGNKE